MSTDTLAPASAGSMAPRDSRGNCVFNNTPVTLVVGQKVLVVGTGLGATGSYLGFTGEVAQINKTRVVVQFDFVPNGAQKSSRVAIHGSRLAVQY